MAAGVTSASTLERLRAAGDAGTLPAADAHTLEDAFELFTELRMEHQVDAAARRARARRPSEPGRPQRADAQLSEGGVSGGRVGAEAHRRRAEPRRAMRLRRGSARAARRAPPTSARACPRGRTPWREASYCAVDLELQRPRSAPRRDRLLRRRSDRGRTRPAGRAPSHGRVRPLRSISEAAIRVHGLRAADLADAPPLDVAIDPLLAAMAGRIPVVHVAAVERGFLRPALRRQGAAPARADDRHQRARARLAARARRRRPAAHVARRSRRGARPARRTIPTTRSATR